VRHALHRIERLGRVDLRRDFPDRGNRRIRVSGEAHHDIQVNAILVTMSEGDPGLLQIGREQFRLGLSFESVLTHVGHDSDHFARTASGLLIRHDPFPDRIFENYGRFLKRQAKTKLDQAAGLAKNGRREQHVVNDAENRHGGGDCDAERDDRKDCQTWSGPRSRKANRMSRHAVLILQITTPRSGPPFRSKRAGLLRTAVR
jgi:hypothetical protein